MYRILIVLALSWGFAVHAQEGPCRMVVHGVFEEGARTKQAEISGERSGVRITRRGSFQKEKDHDAGTAVKYKVTWVDPCTFQLTDRSTKRGIPARAWAEGDTITVHITEVRPNGYDYERTSTFSTEKTSGTMQRTVQAAHSGVISFGF